MKITILGAGRKGLRLAKILATEKNDITIIDINEKKTDIAMSRIDCLAYLGDGISLKDLSEAGIEGSDAFISVTGNDQINLIASAMAKDEFKIPNTLSIVKHLSLLGYKKNKEKSLLGINHIVNPNDELASHIYTEISQGVFKNTISFQNSKLLLYTITIDNDSPYNDMAIKDFQKTFKQNFIIATILRNNTSIVPSGNTKIKNNDFISIVTKPGDSNKILSTIGIKKSKTKKIVIVGANQITEALLYKISQKNRSKIIVIDKNPTACNTFSHNFPEILVVNGNITDEEIFKECNLFTSDLLLSITDKDELNIIVASYAKQVGIPYSMALIKSNNNYLRMAKHLNIDDVISTQKVAVDSLMRHLHGDNVKNIHSLFDGQMQAIEYKIPTNCKIIDKKLKDINMKNKGIIAGIINENGSTIIPDGDYTIKKHDLLIIIVSQKDINSVLGEIQ